MTRSEKRIARIHQQPMTSLLAHLGYRVRTDAGGREQQFACDLHGDGRDNKPSSRVYPDTNTAYCFVCGYRDSIQLVRDKLGLSFGEALRYLENLWLLPVIPYEYGDEEQTDPNTIHNPFLSEYVKATSSYEDTLDSVSSFLHGITLERSIPRVPAVALWEAVDKINFFVEKQKIEKNQGQLQLLRVLESAMTKVKAQNGKS